MNQRSFSKLCSAAARAAGSDAADNEPKRDADIEAELLRNAFVNFPTDAAASNCGAMLSPSRTGRNSDGEAG